ncbi:hypothetical protein OJ252_2484 [Cryptosporidium canis]|uniref:Uncharacterized protein n=1 Tax=Cryptosporidium canis TaxID=195482 RepID=A0ABQ8P529_9CRYT|nr:hypothetical protein OJ252_2484 [Cryptosporidium canis]
MDILRVVGCYVVLFLLQILSRASCGPVILIHEELVSEFGQQSKPGPGSRNRAEVDQVNGICDGPNRVIEFIIQHVPLVHEGYIGLKCRCMHFESEGVPDLNGSQLKGLRCTSENNLLSPNLDMNAKDVLKEFAADTKLIEFLYRSYVNRGLGLEIVSSIGRYSPEEFCKVGFIGLKDDLVAFPKLDTEHYSLIETGMSFCNYMGRRENVFFEHPSPVTEILEGDIFQDTYYFNPNFSPVEEYDKMSKYYNEGDVFEWDLRHDEFAAGDGQDKVSSVDQESEQENYSSPPSEFEEHPENVDSYYGTKYHFGFEPFLRLSYKAKKPYPRVFVKSNPPYTKAVSALNRSIKYNYYSVAGKWQVSITPGYSRVSHENSILSILGSKYNSKDREKYVVEKLKDIAFRWRKLTFSNSHKEFRGCSVGAKGAIPRYYDSFKVYDPTKPSFNAYPSNFQTETVFEIMNSRSLFSDSFQSGRNHCSFNGNIRECLRLIRSRIRDKTLNFIIGHLLVNIIYESWITWGSEIWHISSMFNVEKLFMDIPSDGNINTGPDPFSTLITRLFGAKPLKDDKMDIISLLKSNLERDDLNSCSLEMDALQFGVLSMNPLLLNKFWSLFAENNCMISSDSAFVTWITNKFSFKLPNKQKSESSIEDESRRVGKSSNSVAAKNQVNSWLTSPLPTYFDKVDPEVEVEHGSNIEREAILPETYEYSELLEMYMRNDPGVEAENSIKRRRFFNSNYFSKRNNLKWVSFIVRNVPFRDNMMKSLEFKCGIGYWPYKGGEYSWIGNYFCEVAFLSTGFHSHGLDFSSYESYYSRDYEYNSDEDGKSHNGDPGRASKDDKNESHFIRLSRNRMVGIEFETSYPHRCGIGYLGNESQKTLTSVKGNHLLKISLGFCIMHGFKLQWLSDDSFNIHTEVLYKYTQALETGMTYYERNGFELSGSVQQRVYSNNTCSGVILDHPRNGEFKEYSFKSQTMECQISYDPIIVTDGMRKDELFYMRDKYINLLFDLRFGCDDVESISGGSSGINSHCLDFYPLLERVELDSKKPTCKFELEKEWKIIKKYFPNECRIGSRIGDCHKKIRSEMKCDKKNRLGCRLDKFITENFVKPANMENISIHFDQISLLLMQGINRYTRDWNKVGVSALHDLVSKLVSRNDLDFYLENGINGILKHRLSLFMDEFLKNSNDETLNQAKELFSYSGIWIDAHTIPLFWRLAMFRIEDIPFFTKKPDLFRQIFGSNISQESKSFRMKSKGGARSSETMGSGHSAIDQSIRRKYDISSNIPLYCPLAIGYFWIDKFMWQMYRYPGSNLQDISPIKV